MIDKHELYELLKGWFEGPDLFGEDISEPDGEGTEGSEDYYEHLQSAGESETGFHIHINYPTNRDRAVCAVYHANRPLVLIVIMRQALADSVRLSIMEDRSTLVDKLIDRLYYIPVAFTFAGMSDTDSAHVCIWKEVYLDDGGGLRTRLMQAVNDVWRAFKYTRPLLMGQDNRALSGIPEYFG